MQGEAASSPGRRRGRDGGGSKVVGGAADATAVEEADIALSAEITAARHHPAVRALGTFGELGDQPPLFGLCAGIVAAGALRRDSRIAAAGAMMLLSFGAATAIKAVLKRSVSRTRPHVLLDEGRYEVRPLGPDAGPWHSFPSGHTAGSVAAARALARVVPEAALPAYAAAAVVAAAQLPTARHFASDVVAGAAIGVAAEALARRGVRLALAVAARRAGG
ncbi:phosphatase PAP2 family protein [Enterovirga aerilata]|uniref:Phosphatase PAP2 family protein n=1 Tax=Enterovirga aerilata TaxID=2730920 RepID=A0A849I7V3_9HYPH|nr:phosphatase PAP2 family protein [Enterovirga sp. DB1703]NNM73391.1 phosphatase PAP2 family protein [Enterovirga sp. DB1703]